MRAQGVRNLQTLQLEPRERFNVFVGNNGQGKTNLLEAIYVVAALRSFRTAKLSDMIAFGGETTRIAARVVKDSPVRRPRTVAGERAPTPELANTGERAPTPELAIAGERAPTPELAIAGERTPTPELANTGERAPTRELAIAGEPQPPGELVNAGERGMTRGLASAGERGMTSVYEIEVAPGGRKVRLDGKAVRPLSRYFGGFNVVVFTPEDLSLARGAPSERRRFLDRAVFNLRADYLATVQDFEKVLKQRNTVLRMSGQGVMAPARVEEMLTVYDQQLAQLGLVIANARASFLDDIRDELTRAFVAIARNNHVATTKYVSKIAGATQEHVEAMMRAGRAKDLASQSTQLGPHRDDLAFELDGRDAGGFASQGQLRAIMLAWKTAELAVLARAHGDLPILLLDDVSSELDPERNAYLFEHLAIGAGQCFITTTHQRHVLLSANRADYRIENGQISS